ncbi:MAG: DNA polymerase III subunit delta [Muribaculaceae bacterium]|nr:DNA polymerase III subunit delta [Muribaculaceae bacterium]
MAAATPTFENLRKAIRNRELAPVYLLHGEEGYFIDALVKEFENVLSDDEKAFNQYVLYAPEVQPAQVYDLCHRIPMMSDRQMVILKEAQAVSADKLNKLHAYVSSPVASTVLVICCRGAQAKGKDLLAALRKSDAVIFESKKVTDYNAPALIGNYIKSKGLTAQQKSLEMLRDFIGTDLSRLFNEVDKLASILPEGAEVTPEVVERNIGISREFNSYELVDAIAVKNAEKCFRIAAYFRSNPKAAPLVMVTASIFNYFADLLTAHYSADRSDAGLSAALGLRNNFALRRIKSGMANYSAVKVVEIISAIRTFDARSKGVGSRQNDQQLFYDLLYHILTAPGRI